LIKFLYTNTTRQIPVAVDERHEDRVHVSLSNNGTGNTFVIDEEEDEDDGLGPREEVDPHKIGISRTDKEREQALALHMMAGLKKGDLISISREALPGAVLFPAIKYKDAKIETGDPLKESETDSNIAPFSTSVPVEGSQESVEGSLEGSEPASPSQSPSQVFYHCLVFVLLCMSSISV
jgi:hypothetical protein